MTAGKKAEQSQLDDITAAVSDFFAGLGVTAIEWADDDGNVSLSLDTATGTLTEGGTD